MANSAITGPQALIAAGNRAYRPPKMPGWAGHMGNVGEIVLAAEGRGHFWGEFALIDSIKPSHSPRRNFLVSIPRYANGGRPFVTSIINELTYQYAPSAKLSWDDH
jgi:hypothetical protein